MAKGFKNFIIAILVIGLFAVSLMTFGISYANINGANSSFADDPRINATLPGIIGNITLTESDLTTSKNNFDNSTVTESDEGLVSKAIAGIRVTITGTFFVIFNILGGFLAQTLFGGSFGIVFSVISAIATLMFIVYGWKFIRQGDPD